MNIIRYMSVFLIVIISMSMGVGCTNRGEPNTSPVYTFGTDCQYLTASDQRVGYGYAETEDSIYYLDDKNGYLHVIDKKTMVDSFLCAKPNCLHDKDDAGQSMAQMESCNAFMGLVYRGINYYDGFLYVLCLRMELGNPDWVPELTKVSLDGTSREVVWMMEWEEDYQGIPSRFFLHRGKFYFQLGAFQENPETGVTESCGNYFYAYDLEKKQVKRLFGSSQITWHFFAIGNYLYVSWIEDGDPETHVKTRYDLTTGEIIDFPHCLNVLQIGDHLVNYNIYARKIEDGYTLTHTFGFFDLNGEPTQKEIIFDFEHTPYGVKQVQTDGKNIFIMDGIYGDCVRMYDLWQGKETACVPIPEFVSHGDRLLGCTREGKLLLYTLDSRDASVDWEQQFFYCNISDIGTPDFQWYEVEKIN